MWTYCDEKFEPSDSDLEKWIGFVYIVTQKSTGLKYIGKKLFWRSKILPKTKTRKRRKRTKVISDWRDYCGSSTNVKQILKEHGLEAFDREILHLCETKGECSYLEAKEQFDRDALLRDDYLNGIINCRINRTHLKMELLND